MALRFRKIHSEVLSALEEIGNPKLGERMGPDRVSQLEYSGVRVPNRRKRVIEGFSFYDRSPEEILAIWDDLWTNSPNADVKFCALDYYRDDVRKNPDLKLVGHDQATGYIKSKIGRILTTCAQCFRG